MAGNAMTSNRRTNEPSPLEVEPSTAGASGAGDLEEWEHALIEKWQVRTMRLEKALNAIPGVKAKVTFRITLEEDEVQE